MVIIRLKIQNLKSCISKNFGIRKMCASVMLEGPCLKLMRASIGFP
jgi:hypothetical protein